MPYWIHENGEVVGPMRAIDVLKRARPQLKVSDGESWFQLDEARARDATRGDRASATAEPTSSPEVG
jgi:hypothetical protein